MASRKVEELESAGKLKKDVHIEGSVSAMEMFFDIA
jgi:hypothetical protein